MKKKQKRNINIGVSNIMIKEKINEEKKLKPNKMINSDINTKIQNIRNNAFEKLKLISISNDKNLLPVNTESLFKVKKINNYQPISSKASNNNPFRSSSKVYKEKINIKKNIPSINKLFISNISNSFTAKEKIINKSKKEEISSYSNIPETDKNKSRQKDKIILKHKNLYNIVEKTISINDYSVNISDIKGKEINFEDRYAQQYNIKKNNSSKPKKAKNLNLKIIEKNETKIIKDDDVKKKANKNKIGTDYYKDNKKTKIKINGNNKEIINGDDENKIINNLPNVKKDDINLINNKEEKSNKNSLKNIKKIEEKIEEISRENENISEKESKKNDKYDEMKVDENMKSNGIEKESNILKDSINNDNDIYDNKSKSKDIINNNIIYEDKANKEVNNQKVVDYSYLIKSNDFKVIDNYNNNEFNKNEENNGNEIIDFEEELFAQKNLEENDIKENNEDCNKKDNNDNNSNKNNNENNSININEVKNEVNNKEAYNNNYYNKKVELNGSEENYDDEKNVNTIYLEIEEKIRQKENIITYLNNKKKREKDGKNKYSNKNIKINSVDNVLNNGMNKITNFLNEKGNNDSQNGNLEKLYNQNYNNENIEINHIIKENNLNGNDIPKENKEYSYEKNDFKTKNNSKNNGVEIINYAHINDINNDNKIDELDPNKNRIKPKYEVIEISLDGKKGKKANPKLKERKEKIEKSKLQMAKNVISSQEVNPSSNLIDDIQNLIIKSKQKVANDLDKIEKIDKNSKIISIPIKNINKNKKEVKIKKNNPQKDLLDKSSNTKKIETNVKHNLNKHPFNKKYDTDWSLNKKNNSNLNNSKSKSKSKSKNLNSNNKSKYKKENEIMSKKLSSQISIKKNYINNFIESNINEIRINEKDLDSPHRPKKESTSQKKNYRNTKYDNIDLNTFFTKSSKKEDKNSYNNQNINNINTQFKEENGGIINKYENNTEAIIKEEEQEQEVDSKFKNKKEIKKIIISPKKNNKIKLEEINDEDNNEKDKNELININKELINKITLLKKEVEYSKKEMRKKDEKILRYLNRFDKIASENAYNNAEILNLEEELMNRKKEMDMKTKKINELMNINTGLEQEMNQLKIYYKSKENYLNLINKNDFINSNETENKDDNEIKVDFNNEENINHYEEDEDRCNFEELNVEELHSKRNSLIKKRTEITALYNKLPTKIIGKEQMEQKNELENKITKINNDLVKIRLQLKNISQ